MESTGYHDNGRRHTGRHVDERGTETRREDGGEEGSEKEEVRPHRFM